jgi:proline dehydrogenase
MSLSRRILLKASKSVWLRERAPQYRFVQRTARRFLPGQTPEQALEAARMLAENGVGAILTHLGENINHREEAEAVVQHYVGVLRSIRASGPAAEFSVKLTQLGLDLDEEFCFTNVIRLTEESAADKTLWIDMEQSAYTDATVRVYRRALAKGANAGICMQAYLYRTEQDVESLVKLGGAVRLVKGAYSEPSEIAFPRKQDVDENFFRIAQALLGPEAQKCKLRAAIGTHDRTLIARIVEWGTKQGVPKERLEFQMLYGIQRGEQLRLAREGYRSGVLINYGSSWYPWFMRRMAERPANVMFLARNLFSG